MLPTETTAGSIYSVSCTEMTRGHGDAVMRRKAKTTVIALVVVVSIGFGMAYGANVAEVEKLHKTRSCPGCNLKIADLHGMDLSGANLNHADLSGAKLAGAKMIGVDLQNASLKMADLSQAALGGAKLGNADLTAANLYKADLRSANLLHADLSSANMREANLSNAIWTDGRKCMAGSIGECR